MTLTAEISTLKTLVNTLLTRVSHLESENSMLRQENIMLRQENVELKSKLAKNSSNSHKPPSSDGYSKKPAIAKESTKSVGGQQGNVGKTLQMVSNPDVVIGHHLEICPSCQQTLSIANVVKVGSSHQVFDLPAVKLMVTEHQLLVSKCTCGCESKAVLPAHLSTCPTQYGSNIKALSSYLNTDFKIPFHKISTLFGDLYGYNFNASTAFAANEELYEHLQPVESQIKEELLNSLVVHADETGVRCEGKLQWLHVASNELYTYLFVHPKRGKMAIESAESILPDVQNYLMHDCWGSYFGLTKAKHLICNAHLIRELQALIEKGSQWANTMQQYLLNLFTLTKETVLAQELAPKYLREFHQICQRGFLEEPAPQKVDGKKGKTAKSKGRNLLERLTANQDAMLSFAFHQGLPFTNNQAERDLRTVKTKQKVSTCFRTKAGANHYARIQGFISTIRKQNQNPFLNLKLVFENQFQWEVAK